jgi:hypothetical protein
MLSKIDDKVAVAMIFPSLGYTQDILNFVVPRDYDVMLAKGLFSCVRPNILK